MKSLSQKYVLLSFLLIKLAIVNVLELSAKEILKISWKILYEDLIFNYFILNVPFSGHKVIYLGVLLGQIEA